MPFRDLLNAANLRHGPDGFASPPKEGMLRIFSVLGIHIVNTLHCSDNDDGVDDDITSAIIKFKQLDHWHYQYVDTVLELLTGSNKNCKNLTGK
jgi:hypothetical protein